MPPFYRDTWVEVQLNHIYENIRSLKRFLPKDANVMAVVKANAYGHGDLQIARVALKAGATYLAVAFLDEALSLRGKGIIEPILVLGAVRPEDAVIASEQNVTLSVHQLEWLKEASNNQFPTKKLSLHIKVDTGMNRLGVKDLQEFKEMIEFIKSNEKFELEGVYTHFATADEIDISYFEVQLKKFKEALSLLKELEVNVPIVHCGNSATGLRFPLEVCNIVRTGIAMYGLSPSEEIKDVLPFPLKEAFSLHSRLTHVKKLLPGECVSYGATYKAEKEEWIGTVPIGYADGWIRSLKNREVLVQGKRVPIVGRICMDQFMIRLPGPFELGTKVTLIGEQEHEKISIDEVAKELGTINYEIPCMINYRVPRVYKEANEIVEIRNYLF